MGRFNTLALKIRANLLMSCQEMVTWQPTWPLLA
ncbi:hypothetical protein COLO4_04890 [Corchorus olitorius]|uniref:Uncharacterized protein n=1 Tax=Corchorus olitorius TaxID=93759 RepID=A0A1R3KSI1_9ROSI|nr:hypothetical protein COLO4_13665 [Corchorus olitorius]OMP10030.1 hypothetical protein COLO4_04890 [Corchorus olitorius]